MTSSDFSRKADCIVGVEVQADWMWIEKLNIYDRKCIEGVFSTVLSSYTFSIFNLYFQYFLRVLSVFTLCTFSIFYVYFQYFLLVLSVFSSCTFSIIFSCHFRLCGILFWQLKCQYSSYSHVYQTVSAIFASYLYLYKHEILYRWWI